MNSIIFATLLSATLFPFVVGASKGETADGAVRPPGFRIALVSDPHVTRGTAEDQSLYKGRFAKVIADVNNAQVDLVLVAGDLTQSGMPEDIEDFAAQVRGFAAPVRWVFGNHDVGMKILAGKPGGTTAERTARLEASLGPSFFMDVRGGGSVRIIGINSGLLGSGFPRENEQWAFLESVLAKKPPEKTTTLLLSHYPAFLTEPSEPGGEYWNIEPVPRRRLLALMKKGGVSAFLSGHLHRPLRKQYDGVEYIGTHPISFGLPRGKQPQGWTLVTIAPTGSIQAEAHDIKD